MSYLLDACQISTENIKKTQTPWKKVSEFTKSESIIELNLKANAIHNFWIFFGYACSV